MLTREQAIDVLTYAASYDNRKPNAAAVASWMQASDVGRWSFDDAVEAITQHYANTTEHLMPGHITAYVKAQRAAPKPYVPEQRQLDRPPAASPDTIRDVMGRVARDLGWDNEIDRRSALAVACPVDWCRAAPGDQCHRAARTGPGGRADPRVPVPPHPSRRDAAAAHETNQEAHP